MNQVDDVPQGGRRMTSARSAAGAPAPIWMPRSADVDGSRIADFMGRASERSGLSMKGYSDLWRWSTTDLPGFWRLVWDYFDIPSSVPYDVICSGARMPDVHWFTGARSNYVDQVLRWRHLPGHAVVSIREDGTRRAVGWEELATLVRGFAATLRAQGVRPGDAVVGYLGNSLESVVAFLGAASVGAVWAACGLDYGAEAARARLGQLRPVLLVAQAESTFNGATYQRASAIESIVNGVPSISTVVMIERATARDCVRPGVRVLDWHEAVTGRSHVPTEQVPSDHPLWVLFSSGTTGVPKGIVHGHLGVVAQHLVLLALSHDLGPQSVFFWYTTPNWMMWNLNVSGLLTGATIVTYEGSPTYPSTHRLWDVVDQEGVTLFGTSPGYLQACIKDDLTPGRDHQLTTLRQIGVTGAPLAAEATRWVQQAVGDRIQVVSTSGGTDVVSAFIGGAPNLPVYPGEMSGPSLGVALAAFDEAGEPVVGTPGELVVTRPMPSMPVRFWGDPDGSRYRRSYFDTYPHTWRHGDSVTITERGTAIIHGRSDSTINRNGVRMGSADLYQVIERLPEVREALVVGCEMPDGSYWMPLFVVSDADGVVETLWQTIQECVRRDLSPRHVPDELFLVRGIPHTRTGKKLEVPVKRILQGAAVTDVVSTDAVDDASLLGLFVQIGRAHRQQEA